jgi:hypothetical protein
MLLASCGKEGADADAEMASASPSPQQPATDDSPGASEPEPPAQQPEPGDAPEPSPVPGPGPGPMPTSPDPTPVVNPQPDVSPQPEPEPAPAPMTSGGAGPDVPANPGGAGSGGTPAGGAAGAPTGGGGSSGGTAGAAGAQPAGDACDAALLCDDFEDDTSGMAPGAPWTVDVNGGGVEVSSERAFSGSNSVYVSNSQGAYKRAYFSVTGDPVFPAAGAEMYGRMMMWLEATPAGSVHWTFIQGEGPSDDGSYDIFYRYGGQHEGKLMANFETVGRSTDCWDHSATVMPTQTWACLEWRFDTASDEMQFWLDGSEISDIHVVGQGEGCGGQDLNGAWPAPPQFEVLRLGWEKYQESSALNAWIDDVAVSTERVGCPSPVR